MTLFKAKENNNKTKRKTIRTCCTGEVFDLSLVSNSAISSKVLGDGFGVSCSDSLIVSPGDGIVTDISDNGHTYAIEQEDGVSLLVCITSDSKNEVLDPAVETGQHISAGDPLCTKENAEAAVIITNTEILSYYKIAVGKAKFFTDGVIVYEL